MFSQLLEAAQLNSFCLSAFRPAVLHCNLVYLLRQGLAINVLEVSFRPAHYAKPCGASPPSKLPSKSHIEGVAKLVNQPAPRKTISETSGKIFPDSTNHQLRADSRRQKKPALDLRSYQRFRSATPRSHHQLPNFSKLPGGPALHNPPSTPRNRLPHNNMTTFSPAVPAKRFGFRCTARSTT